MPPSHLLTPGYKEWADEVSKASHGSIAVTLYPSSQLGSGADHYDMVKRGVADFGLINPGYTPGRFPVIATSDLPFMVTDSLKAAPALTRWYRKYAAKEMPEHYVCHVFTHEPGTFHSKKLIRVPADVKGLNVRTANQTMAQYVTSIGGNSVQVPIMEAYETLKRGITDAITVPWGGLTHPAFKFGTVTEYTLDIPLYVSTFTHGISRKTYNSMSDAQKKVIDSVSLRNGRRRSTGIGMRTTTVARKRFENPTAKSLRLVPKTWHSGARPRSRSSLPGKRPYPGPGATRTR